MRLTSGGLVTVSVKVRPSFPPFQLFEAAESTVLASLFIVSYMPDNFVFGFFTKLSILTCSRVFAEPRCL